MKNSENQQLVVKDNALMNASYELSVVEQRLILLSITQARETGHGINANDPLVISADSYAHQFNVSSQAAYEALTNAVKTLYERGFKFIEKSGHRQTVTQSRWVSQVGYNVGAGSVVLIFAPAVIPLITRLEEKFTSYDMAQISNLTTRYAIRLYEVLITWRAVGKTPLIQLAELRAKLGVLEESYLNIRDFKHQLLFPAMKQINAHTDIHMEYEQVKHGKTIKGFTFSFTIKSPETETPLKEPSYKLSVAQTHLYGALLAQHPTMGDYANVGESYEDFAFRLAELLKSEVFVKANFDTLKEVGFVPKY